MIQPSSSTVHLPGSGSGGMGSGHNVSFMGRPSRLSLFICPHFGAGHKKGMGGVRDFNIGSMVMHHHGSMSCKKIVLLLSWPRSY